MKKKLKVREISQIGMLAAIAVVLMLFEIPLPFAPTFYKIDLSEVPVLVGCFAIGPGAGAMIEFVKILLNFVINGTETAGIGEVANFIIGCAMCIPAGMVYWKAKNKKGALLGMIVGTIFMTIVGCLVNAYVLLPTYAVAFHMPIDELVSMGSMVNEKIRDLFTFVIFAVAPFNLVKGFMVSGVVLLTYKKISPVFKMNL